MSRPPGAPRRAVPHVREFLADSLSPLAAYRRLGRLSPHRFLLESVTGGDQVSRFSFLGASPRQLYRLYQDRLEVEDADGRRTLPGEPLAALTEMVSQYSAARGPIPFAGGFVGYFGYDLARLVERLPNRPPDPHGLPVALLGRYDTVVVFDHARQRVLVVANELEGETTAAQAAASLEQVTAELTRRGGDGAVALPPGETGPPADAGSRFDGDAYRRAVATAKEHIYAGDIFQTVLARRFEIPRRVDPLALYRALRVVNPSPYMVLLESPEAALVGASPEMLVRKTGDTIETRPIAGTRPRGADPAADRQLARELLADPKELAEHIMLVDLGRNDIGKVARPGTVKLASYQEIERYSHVMHIVSSVEGKLDRGLPQGAAGALAALLACFPAGTVSGAPKVRAMEIIDDLEPEARGPYAGAVGYLSYGGDMDTCITIRTLLVRPDGTSVTAGAGIVADSDPASEERETESKAAGMLAAVGLAERLAARSESDERAGGAEAAEEVEP